MGTGSGYMIDIRDWIASHAYRSPDRIAQIDHATGRRFTYREMHERVAAIAGQLREIDGIEIGDVVAVLAPNSSDIFDIDFACGRIGAIFLPMNTRLAVPEIAFQLNDARPKVLFVGAGYEILAKEAVKYAGVAVTLYSLGAGGEFASLEEINAQAPRIHNAEKRHAKDGWNLIYSSGTTGKPKGVLHTHGGIMMQAISNCVGVGISANSSCLGILPQFHISGLNLYGHAMFYAGGKTVTLERVDPPTVLKSLGDPDYAITHFIGVPTIFEMVAQLPEFVLTEISHVECATVGGAPSTKSLLETYARKGLPLMQGYGLTETGPALTVLSSADAVRKIGSCGKPMMHVDLKVVKADGEIALANEVGEILAKGPSVITEYFRRPEAHESCFNDGWLRTGDLGRFDEEGFLYIVDRKKDMFISGGENVYPAEVENCISSLPDIVQVAVFGVPNDKWGEVGAACIVKLSGSELTADDVISHCNNKIARYKIPKHVIFLDSMPLNGTGKILKSELRKMVASDLSLSIDVNVT